MALLIELVPDGVLGRSGTGTEGSVGVFGDLLVCLVGGLGGSTLDGLRDVVCGVPERTVLARTKRASR
jgi:hypothetical protein